MGVVNVTPDSFSDGGLYLDPEAAIAHGIALRDDGCRGARRRAASRPGPAAAPVPAEEEAARVVPVVRALAAGSGVPVSVDTTKAIGGRGRAIEAGRDDRQRRLRGPPRPGHAAGRRRRGRGLRRDAHAGRAAHDAATTRTTTTCSTRSATFLRRAARRPPRAAGIADASRSWPTRASGSARRVAHNLTLLAGVAALVERGRRAGPRRRVAQVVHRPPARRRRARSSRRRHARDRRLGARPGCRDGPGPRRARHAPRGATFSTLLEGAAA